MRPKVHILTSVRLLRRSSRRVRFFANEALRVIRRRLRVHDVDIVIAHRPSQVIPHLGIGGKTPHGHLAFVWVDATRKNFLESIRRNVLRTMAHELHHAARFQGPGYGATLFEAMVSEGLADHFEIEVTGGRPQRWDRALSDVQAQTMMKRARRDFRLKRKDYDHQAWFFGSKRRKIPKWTGYALGFSIVGKYLRAHPNQRPSQLVKTPAKNFSTSA